MRPVLQKVPREERELFPIYTISTLYPPGLGLPYQALGPFPLALDKGVLPSESQKKGPSDLLGGLLCPCFSGTVKGLMFPAPGSTLVAPVTFKLGLFLTTL